MAKWYVMYTKPRQESVALDNLQRQNYTVFYPQARVLKRKAGKGSTAVVEPLFPRYMFVRLEVGVDDFFQIALNQRLYGFGEIRRHSFYCAA